MVFADFRNFTSSFFAILCLFSLQPASAATTASSPEQLGDPAWLPNQGQAYSDTSYAYTGIQGKTTFASGGGDTFRYSQTDITEELAYGITDRLALGIGDSYTPWAKHDYNSGDGEYKFGGFEDPTIGLTYRAIDQRNAPLNVDATIEYSPNLISAKLPDNNNTGTVANGGQVVTAEIAPSYVTANDTVRAVAGTVWFSSSKSESDYAPGTYERYQPAWEFIAELQNQFRIGDRYAINASVTESKLQNYNISEPGNDTFTYESGYETQLLLGGQVRIIPNKLVLSVTDTYGFSSNGKDKYADPTDNSTYSDQHGNTIGASLEYTFN